MNNMIYKYVPARIRQARIARGLTQEELAEKIGVTKGAISQFEKGTSVPRPNVITQISLSLNFPLSFFTQDIEPVIAAPSAVLFRQKDVCAKQQDAASQIADLIEEMVRCGLKQYIEFPNVNMPVDFVAKDSYSIQDCIDYASHLREYWGLGLGPIDNLFQVVQANGIIISCIDLPETKMDAYSCFRNGTPFIIIERNKLSSVRRRFSLAHELGHLVLHSHLDCQKRTPEREKAIENEAWWFAGAFMLPPEMFFRDLCSDSIDHLLFLKKKWKLSMQAMFQWAYDCDVFTDSQRQSFYRKMNYNKWKIVEPLDDICNYEEANMLCQALKLILENDLILFADIENRLCRSRKDIAVWCNTPEILLQPQPEPIKLKVLK